jgi:mono/diheme cytochrome c family protein
MNRLTIISVLIAFVTLCRAEDVIPGKIEYLSSCAACHGEDGKGNGVLASFLKVPPADLTTLSRRNDGYFPLAAVTEIIDGRTLIAAHGTREMPIWGFDVKVRNRIPAIADYLNHIQRQ